MPDLDLWAHLSTDSVKASPVQLIAESAANYIIMATATAAATGFKK